jgi:hypothetical protein
MSENTNPADFAGATAAPRGCERAEEFVTYLYGEATPEESKAFRLHLEACPVCRDELASLGGVREAVGAWRTEALGTLPSLDISRALAPSVAAGRTPERRRSAAAAFREFFSLAPLWLRAGAFAATLAVCALAALTLARAEVSWDANGLAFRTGGGAPVVKEQPPTPAPEDVYTAEQLDAVVAQRVAEATARLKAEQERQRPTPEGVITVADRGDNKSQPQSAGAAVNAPRRKRAARPDTRRDEPLLAEDNLPRLSDLLDGSY